MFNKDLKKRIRNVEEILGLGCSDWNGDVSSIESITKRLSKIEKQIKPKPKFKKGDLVHFFLIDGEFDGEIVRNNSDYKESCGMSFLLGCGYRGEEEKTKTDRWLVSYLDDNNVVHQVTVDEKDIWTDEEDCIDCLFSEIEDLRLRLKKLEDNKKK